MPDEKSSPEEFKDNPSGLAQRWQVEIKQSLKMLDNYYDQADGTIERFLDNREGDERDRDSVRVNLFWSNSSTLISSLFARLPKVDVSRKFDDSEDDVARVAALIMGRLLNYDIEENGEEYDSTLRACLQDRIVPGMGCARVYYEYEEEEVDFPPIMDEDGNEKAPGYTETQTVDECATIEYYHWRDVCWSWARTWKDLRWLAFRSYLTKEEVRERFGEKYVSQIKYKKQGVKSQGDSDENKEVWVKAEVWEIWSKDDMKVYWWSEGARSILDEKDDPLELKGFFPCPPAMMANVTTSLMVPKPDFCMAQDLYNEIDILETRISILTEAAKVIGVYDKKADGIKRMFVEGAENELIPVDNWAMFAEKGGIQGQIDWLPLDQVVEAIVNLRQVRDDNLALLDKVTGHSDILMGAGTHPREGVGTQEMKASFGSVRIQSLQQDFARFATDLLELKAEVISKHCDPETIYKMANADFLQPHDQQFVQPAISLIKDWGTTILRIKIRSESMAMVDYNRMKAERTEYIMGLAQFLQSSAPLLELDKQVAPFLMQILKWASTGFKGSDEIEGVFDAAIENVTKALSQGGQGQDPEIQKEQMRAQAELTKIREKAKADLTILQAKFMAKLQEIQAKAVADQNKEAAQAEFASFEKELETAFDAALAEIESNLRLGEIREQARLSPSKESSG